ncbi:MAG: hypothetical protein RL653_4495 [Pseudomonadota bacterium]|jgi:hypothetical protein
MSVLIPALIAVAGAWLLRPNPAPVPVRTRDGSRRAR